MGSETKEDYLYWKKQTIKAFNKAERIFIKLNDEFSSMECKVKALHAFSYFPSSIEEGKASAKESIDICFKLNKIYSDNNDNNNLIKSSLLLLDAITYLLSICKDPSEFIHYMQLSRDLIEKTWANLKKINNVEFEARLLYIESAINTWSRYIELIYGDKKQEEIRKKLFLRCKETLESLKKCDDFFLLGRVYLAVGMHYCMFGTIFADEEYERSELVEKGFDLLEKSLIFCRISRNNLDLINNIYLIDYLAGVFGRFEYYQKRIFRDVHELQKLSEIYEGSYIYQGILATRTSLMYYHNFSGRSFLKADIRKSFAKLGIEYGKKQLKNIAFGPFFALTYQILTNLYSQLVILATEDDPQEDYIQKMFYYADQANNSTIGYKGGNVKSAGFESIYRANKTMAEVTKNKVKKIKHLKIAIDAQKNNIKYAIESDKVYLAVKLRLGLLYEELGILTTEENPLIEARELFLNVIEDASEKGYEYYSAACYEYIARLEDRLGNYMTSAEYYKKAQISHNKSLQAIEYKPLKDRVNEKIKYAKAWYFIENAKVYHKGEQHLKARENYEKATEILKALSSFNHEAAYYGAWISLEEAEDLSKHEEYDEAIKTYEKTRDLFDNAIFVIRFIRKNVRRSEELKKLEKVAKVRMKHCSARIDLDEARILGKSGEHMIAAEKFKSAASKFRDICLLFKIKRERKEIEAIFHLCKAWENMELAENYENPEKFAEAAKLFAKASDYFTESKLKYLADGNSNFCIALEEGCRFDQSHDIEVKRKLYQKIKLILRKAANLYEKGGFKNASDWALATSIYFDAAWNLIQADHELDARKKKEFLSYGSNYLKSAAELFHKAEYKDKEKEVQERLERVNKEEKILFSALNTINKPSISRSIEGVVTPSCPIETSQSPRIGEIQQYAEEVIKFLEKDSKIKKYEIEYKDLLKEYPKSPRNQCRVGIAQIGISSSGNIINEFYEEIPKGLLTFREEKVKLVESRVKKMIDKAVQTNVNILLFPEMSIDLKYKQFLDDLLDLAKRNQMYIIPGSYHNIEKKSNISLVIGPEGILWQQEKHIPAIISLEKGRFKEGIDTSILPHKTIVCNTEYGRIAIAICRDFLDMDLRVELKNFEPPIDIILNPAFTPVTADFKAVHFDARRSIYAYTFFANIAEYGGSLIYTPEKERIERNVPPREEGLIYKEVDLFRLRSERKKWEIEQIKEKGFIQSTKL
jgi:predicted amidohydrolase/tetratricopeptide (TPR) repeat protein